MSMSKRTKIMAAAGALALLGMGAAAWAQGADDWKAARAQGLVGEQPDGYLGIVGSPTPDLTRMVNAVNIQRKALYTQRAAAGNSSVADYAAVTACNLIADTPQGTKYKTPAGNWVTRTSAAPERMSSCLNAAAQ